MRDQFLRGFELLNARDGDSFAELVRRVYAPDVDIVEPNGRSDLEGGLAGWLGMLEAFEDLHYDIVTVTEGAGRLVVECLVTGTHTGPLRTVAGVVPATGRSLEGPVAIVVEHEDGRIRRWRSYYDQLLLLRQLGLMPEAGG